MLATHAPVQVLASEQLLAVVIFIMSKTNESVGVEAVPQEENESFGVDLSTTGSSTNKKGATKPRFNWKHRFLTSHGSTGSDGQVSNLDDLCSTLLFFNSLLL